MVEIVTEKEVQIDTLVTQFSNIITDAASSLLKFRLFKPKKKRKRKQLWFDICFLLQREVRWLGRRIQNNPDNHEQTEVSFFFSIEKKNKKLIKQKKKEFIHSLLNKLSEMNEKDPKAFWRL